MHMTFSRRGNQVIAWANKLFGVILNSCSPRPPSLAENKMSGWRQGGGEPQNVLRKTSNVICLFWFNKPWEFLVGSWLDKNKTRNVINVNFPEEYGSRGELPQWGFLANGLILPKSQNVFVPVLSDHQTKVLILVLDLSSRECTNNNDTMFSQHSEMPCTQQALINI